MQFINSSIKMKSLEHYKIVLRRKFIRPIMNNHKLSVFVARHCLNTHMAMFYEGWVGKRLNLRHPENINQQLMKLSLEAYKDPIQHKLRVQCADKYRVREYVRSKGLEEILIPSYGVFNSFDEIDFNKLPNQFVIQSNFGCGHIWICKDKKKEIVDIQKWRNRFNEWMAIPDFGLSSSEWQYSEIPHKLVITKYLDSFGAISVNDFKFHCFNGDIYGCLVVYDRSIGEHCYQLDHYDIDWNLTDGIRPGWHPKRREIPKPKCYNRMLEIAQMLSRDFPYCRVDLYEIDGQVLFGELTFTPQGNVMNYYTDEMLQDMLHFFNETKQKS